jgi:hypothetical protein
MRGLSLAALATIAACSAEDPEQAAPTMRPPSHLAVHLSLASDGTVGVVSTTVTSNTEQTTAHSAEALSYTFRTTSGTMIANGTVDDPRPVHAEWFENGTAQRAEAIQPFSSLVLNLPARRGIVEFTDANGIAVGHVEVAPPTNAAPPGSVVQQLISPATDVIGSPVKVVDHGSAEQAFDLLFLPEGYTQAQLAQFHQDVDRVVRELFARPDYARHAHRFNVWRIDVRSANSGVSSASPAPMLDTAFAIRRYAPDSEPLARLFVAGDPNGMAAARELGMRVNADATFIIANTTYGGSGGAIAVASNDSHLPNVVAHELGHSILHLADEYFDATNPERTAADCSSHHPDPLAVNVAYASDRASLPWSDLVYTSTPLPSTDLTSTAVGAYLGGDRCANNRYRPTPHCLMNTNLEDSFCPVCQRAMDNYFSRFGGGDPTGTTGTGTGTGTGSDPGAGTGTDPGTGTGTDPGTGTGTGSDPGTGTGTDTSSDAGTGTGSDPTPSCRYACADGYVPGQCYGGWACTGACLEYTGCSATDTSSGSSGSAGSDPAPTCEYTCASRGYAEGQCYMGYYCNNGCITYTGCSDGSSGSSGDSAGSGSGSATCEYWTCESQGYEPFQCVDHYYCDGSCIIPNGC